MTEMLIKTHRLENLKLAVYKAYVMTTEITLGDNVEGWTEADVDAVYSAAFEAYEPGITKEDAFKALWPNL